MDITLTKIDQLQDIRDKWTDKLEDLKEAKLEKQEVPEKDFNLFRNLCENMIYQINDFFSPKELKMIELQKMICDISGVSWQELKDTTKRRLRKYVTPRQVHMVALHITFDMNPTDSSKVYNKDHATFAHAKKTVKNLIETDVQFRDKYRRIFEFCVQHNKNAGKKINLNWL